jgi:hypothetical protein
MLRLVALVEQWKAIQEQLPDGWTEVRLRLTVDFTLHAERAAALLGPANPGRRGKAISFRAARRGDGPSPELVRRLLARLDRERISGRLQIVSVQEAVAEPEALRGRGPLAVQWEAQLAALPDDWSDLWAEVELASSDHLERAALLLAPVNPTRFGSKPGFRFRVARRYGYGASPEMTKRCFERLDAERIAGSIRILHALSDTRPVATQGPVWYVGGRVV